MTFRCVAARAILTDLPDAACSKVLDASFNKLTAIPVEAAWLPLKEIHLEGNDALIPPIVLEGGFR